MLKSQKFKALRIAEFLISGALFMELILHQPGTANAATSPVAGTCMSKTISSMNSPDNLWKYTLIEGYCAGEYTFDVTDVYRVYVTSLNNSAKNEWVYQVDADPYPQIVPIMRWSGAHALFITAYKDEYYKVNPPAFSDVSIRIIYR